MLFAAKLKFVAEEAWPSAAMESAEYIDQMMLFSGDGDFGSPLAAVQRRSVLSQWSTAPSRQ